MSERCEDVACALPVHARGRCSRHYRALLRDEGVLPAAASSPCAVADCGRRAVTRGWCHGHYLRWRRTGDVQAARPLSRPVQDGCRHPSCDRGAVSAGWCRSHARRVRLYGDPDGGRPARLRTAAGGSLSHGYWLVPVRPDQRHLVPAGRTKELEHRLVMAEVLGRPLLPDEVVHHRNGDRLDNSPANLELWCTAQPKGQRVEDKVAFARALLQRYDPSAQASDAGRPRYMK